MSQGAERAALPSEPVVAAHPETAASPRRRYQAWLPLIPAVLTLGVTLYQIQGPSFSMDEDATLLAVHRTFPQLVQLLGKIDVVHGAYYSLTWVITRLFGASELAVRFPSAVALALAAGGVALLGQRLVSPQAGLAAGLVFAVLPSVSWYAEDARDYGIATALAVATSYALVRALEPGARRRRWLVAYAVALAFLGLSNLFALLIIPAHAITLASRMRHDPAIGRPFALRWLVAVVAALVAVSPVAVTGYHQLRVVSWIHPLTLRDVLSVMRLAGTRLLFGFIAAIVVAAIVAGAIAGRNRLRAHWPGPTVALAVPWLVLPPVVLLVTSLAHPVYTERYIAICIPALALLAGTALAALGRIATAAGLIVLLLVGLPTQIMYRGQDGHGFNIRRVDQIVARYERPGDDLLTISGAVYERVLAIGYPYGLAPLHDVGRGRSPVQSVTMGGTYAPEQVVRQRLASATRLWVVGGEQKDVPTLRGLHFTLIRRWYVTRVYIRLYVRDHSASQHPGRVPKGH
jgi:mannosyltransferase